MGGAMTLSPEACRRAAELLLAARRNLAPIPALPEDCRPATVEKAEPGNRVSPSVVNQKYVISRIVFPVLWVGSVAPAMP